MMLLCHGWMVDAQELEPRRWSHLPVDVNYLGAGYSFTRADIYFDPVLNLEDVELDLHTVGAKYIRTFELLDHSARIDLAAPYQDARWEGLLNGQSASRSVNGLADPSVRFSTNLKGAPPLKGEDFAKYRAAHRIETLAGAALSAQVPLGQYDEDRLLNLGENRFVIRPELGLVHNHGKWSAELTGLVSFYTDNDDFWNGNRREQDPLYILHGHLVYTFRPGLWVGGSAGVTQGGESSINGADKDDEKNDILWGLSLGYPINKATGVKLAYLQSRTEESTGFDSDTIASAVSVLW